jgi:hypothetical protein
MPGPISKQKRTNRTGSNLLMPDSLFHNTTLCRDDEPNLKRAELFITEKCENGNPSAGNHGADEDPG